MALKTTDLLVKNWEEKEYQITQVKEWTDFNNDKAHLGWQYEAVLPRLRFEKVFIKVPGETPLFTNAEVLAAGTKTVKFNNLEIGFYARSPKGSEFVELLLSEKADNINLMLDKKTD